MKSMDRIEFTKHIQNIDLLIRHGEIQKAESALKSLTDADLTAEACVALSQRAVNISAISEMLFFAEKAQHLKPDVQEVYWNLILSNSFARRDESARFLCQEFINLFGEHPEILNILGWSHSRTGDFVTADSWFRKAISMHKGHATAIFGLSKCKKFDVDAEDTITLFREALNLISQPQMKAQVHFAIAKILNDLGKFDEAWNEATVANQILRKASPFSQIHRQQLIDTIDKHIENYRPGESEISMSQNESEHLLVVGMPRSGTTLLEQVISAHPQYQPTCEAPAITYALRYGAPGKTIDQTTSLDANDLNACASAYENYFISLGNDRDKRILNKLPHNILSVGFFRQMFPNGKVLYLRRDPKDLAASIFFENFSDANSYTTDVNDILFAETEMSRMMEHWCQVFPEDILTLDYEDFVADMDEQLSNISEFLGINKDDISDYTKATNVVDTPSLWQVRQGPYKSSIGRWKRYSMLSALLADK